MLKAQVYSEQRHFDQNDSESPIKKTYKIEASIDFIMNLGSHFSVFKVSKNIVKFKNTLWEYLFGETIVDFNTIKFHEKLFGSEYQGSRLLLQFILGEHTNQYQHKSQNVLEIFGLIGGLIMISQIIFGTIFACISNFFVTKKYKEELAKAKFEIMKLDESLQK